MISLDTIQRMFCVINLRSSRRPAFGPDNPPLPYRSLCRGSGRQVQITPTLISKQKYSASPQGQDHSYCFSENLVNVITQKELHYLGLGTRCRVGLGPGTLHFCLIAYSHHELNWHSQPGFISNLCSLQQHVHTPIIRLDILFWDFLKTFLLLRRAQYDESSKNLGGGLREKKQRHVERCDYRCGYSTQKHD